MALIERLQIDGDAPAVEGGIQSVGADKGGEAFNRWILEDDAASSCCLVDMSEYEMDCDACDIPWITPVSCTGKEALGNHDIENDGEDEGAEGDQQGEV